MKELSLLEDKETSGVVPLGKQTRAQAGTVPSINWQDSPPIQHLLDVISSIIAEEYIIITKQNPGVFLNNTPRLSELRGCALSGQGANK